MKKLILSALLCAGFIQSLSAQVFQKGNMSVFAGFGASNTIANTLSSVGTDASNTFGPYIIGYQYHITDKLMLGLVYTYQSAATGKQTIQSGTDEVSYKTNVNVSTFLSQLNYSWLTSEKQQCILYSGIALGTYSVNAELDVLSGNKDLAKPYADLKDGIGYHITAIGFKGRFKKDSKLGSFAELGYGVNGIFNVGLQYTFK